MSAGRPPADGRFGDRVHDVRDAAGLLAVGDVQANCRALLDTLCRAGYVSERDDRLDWTAGAASLLFAGDLVDRGTEPAEVLVAVAELHERARAAGGRVILVTGNHDDVMLKTLFGEGKQRAWARRQWFANGGLETLARLAAHAGGTVSETFVSHVFTARFGDLEEIEGEIESLCSLVREHMSRELDLLRSWMRPVALVNDTVLAFHAAPNLEAPSLAEFVRNEDDEVQVLWDRTWLDDGAEVVEEQLRELKGRLDGDGISIRHIVFGHTELDAFTVPGFKGKLYRIGRLVAPDRERGVPGAYNLLTTPSEAPAGGAFGALEFSADSISAIYSHEVESEGRVWPDREHVGPGEPAFERRSLATP